MDKNVKKTDEYVKKNRRKLKENRRKRKKMGENVKKWQKRKKNGRKRKKPDEIVSNLKKVETTPFVLSPLVLMDAKWRIYPYGLPELTSVSGPVRGRD